MKLVLLLVLTINKLISNFGYLNRFSFYKNRGFIHKEIGVKTFLWNFGKSNEPTDNNRNGNNSKKWKFLSDRQQPLYISNILRLSVEEVKKSLAANPRSLLEISFPENRKSDISALESFTTNRDFAKNFVSFFSRVYGNKLWLLLPDQRESVNAVSDWGVQNEFTLTSIDTALKRIQARAYQIPELMVVVNPGFNVEEWIKLAKVGNLLIDQMPSIIIINGNLDRLRNGYYPVIFYPELARVAKSFYVDFQPALVLRPIAIDGDWSAAYLIKTVQESNWQLWVRNKENSYLLERSFVKEPPPQEVWRVAKSIYLL